VLVTALRFSAGSIAGRIGVVTALVSIIGAASIIGAGPDGGRTDADGHSTTHGSSAIDAGPMHAAAMDAAHMGAADARAAARPGIRRNRRETGDCNDKGGGKRQ
jgi:hypothetical protein